MGRKKIQISRISDERNRQVTFNKRKFGVMKKAYELSVLCDCEIALIIFSSGNKLYQYASTDMDKVLLKYTEYNEPHESLTNQHIIEALNKKEHKNGILSPESTEAETDYQLTPRTEAKYSKIDEEFQMMVQRNHLNGQRQVGINSTNYSLPVTIPVNNSYGESSLIQNSPQIAHTSISPRPSSSDTDSMYPSSGMIEISNGYPQSASPITGCASPSPGPSPCSGLNSNKPLRHNQKPHSPNSVAMSGVITNNGSRPNLRVAISTPLNSGISQDELAFNEHNRNTSSSSTVTLQAPTISGLTNYPNSLSTFGPQDFSMNSNDIGITWSSHQMPAPLNHASGGGLPHLTVSNSTSPPSVSPSSVTIKNEPISPPREHLNMGTSNPIHLSSAMPHSSHLHMHTLNLSQNNTRTNSNGHITSTPGNVTPTNVLSPTNDQRHSGTGNGSVGTVGGGGNGNNTVGNNQEYDNSGILLKRTRLNDNWSS